jgi:hypothetical protein
MNKFTEKEVTGLSEIGLGLGLTSWCGAERDR